MDIGLIPSPDGVEKVYHNVGDTNDIIQVVLKGCTHSIKKGFKDFAREFDSSENGLKDIWSFVKYKITYKTDEDGRQDILLPAALWERGWGDCKSKTVFIVHILRCLNIPYIVRFTGYSGKSLTHVYPIAIFNGREVVMDSVYDFFDREKKYQYKKDYNMTKISMISGIKDIDVDRKVKSKMVEIAQKREYIPQQEDIPLNGTVGDARAYLLKRQLVLLRAFNAGDNAKVEDYNKALQAVDKAIVQGPTTFKISGTAYGEVEAQVKNIINTKLKDNRPAMSFNNTFNGRVSQSSIGQIPPNVLLPRDLTVTGQGCTTLLQTDLCYRLGASTQYRKSADKLVPIIMKYLNDNLGKPILDASGNPVMHTVNILGQQVTVPKAKYTINFQGQNTQGVVSLLNSYPTDMQRMMAMFAPASSFPITFGDIPTKTAFEKYVEEQSGVWQQYLNQTVFKEQGGAGCGTLYHYNSNTGIPANNFGSAINSKKAVQSQWMAGMNYLTGADPSIINDMGRNTAIFHLSENPEDSIKKLAAYYGVTPNLSGQPQIGVVITAAVVTLILGILSTVSGTVISLMEMSKRDADRLAPEKALGVSPVGSPLLPDEEDWKGIDEQTGSSSTGLGLGLDTTTLLGLGLLGVGGYYLMSKKSKK